MRDGIYRRGRFWWTRDPVTGRRVSTKKTDRRAALLWKAERERIAADPVYAATHAAKIGHWVNETMKAKAGTRSSGTHGMYRVKLGHVVRFFGDETSLAEITPQAVDRYIEQRRSEGAVDNTIHRELTCLTQMLKLARRAGCYVGDIAALKPVGFSPKYNPRKRWLTRDEVCELMIRLPVVRSSWLAVALSTGARKSEVDRIQREDYDPETQVLKIRGTKTKGSLREVPIPGSELMRFEINLRRLEPWPRASHELPAACKRAGIPPATPNDLRRTFATWMLQDGADENLVARMLGHGSQAMIRAVYGQLGGAKLGKLLAEQTGTSTAQTDPKDDGPLAEIGRRRGFKRPCDDAGSGEHPSGCHVANSETVQDVYVKRTRTSRAEVLGFRAAAHAWLARRPTASDSLGGLP